MVVGAGGNQSDKGKVSRDGGGGGGRGQVVGVIDGMDRKTTGTENKRRT